MDARPHPPITCSPGRGPVRVDGVGVAVTTFAYKSPQGSGTVTAASAAEARAQLRAEGVRVRSMRAVAPPASTRSREPDGGRATRGRGSAGRTPWRLKLRPQRLQLTRFARELATLIDVGTPVLESLELMRRQRDGHASAALEAMIERLKAGASLAESMRAPAVAGSFDELSISLVEVGERSGNLGEVLNRLAAFRERQEEVRSGVGSALLYPAIVLVIAFAVTVFLMVWIIPNIIQSMVRSGRDLPAATLIVKAISDWLLAYGVYAGIAAAAGVLLLARWFRTEAGRDAWARWQLRLPLLGEVARKQAVVHVCVVLSTLLRSGIDFGQACRLTAKNTPHRVMRQALEKAYEAVASGSDVARAVEATGEFPALVVRAFGVGQRSGRMEHTLERVAASYEHEVERTMTRFVKILEPIMILFVAAIILVIVLATLLPILEMSNDL